MIPGMFDHYGRPPAIPGIHEAATLHQIANGWLVSHVSRRATPKPPTTEEREAADVAAREAAKQVVKGEIQKQALAMKFAAKAFHGDDEPWKESESDLDAAVSQIVPHGPQGGGLAYVAMDYPQPEVRAFVTLDEALRFMKELLADA